EDDGDTRRREQGASAVDPRLRIRSEPHGAEALGGKLDASGLVRAVAGEGDAPALGDRAPCGPVVPDRAAVGPTGPQAGGPPPGRDQPPVPVEQPGVRRPAALVPVELRAREGLRRVRVGNGLGPPAERGELATASLADGGRELLVAVVGEVEERRARAPLL